MKKLFTSLALLASFAFANAQVKFPAPSPTQTIKQDFGIGSIEIVYSRPGVKGRTIFGGLEAFGKMWRTGANKATKITLTEPVELAGKKLDTGSYAIYTIPNIDTWEIIINKGFNNGGLEGYKETDDVLRFKVVPSKLKNRVETFTIQFDNVKPESCGITLMWDKTSVTIPVTASFRSKVKAQIEAGLQSEKKPYWEAAQYYNEYEKNLPKALEYATKATEENGKAFWIFLYKAKIQQEMGDKAGALASSQKSLELAAAAKNDAYVKMNQDLQKKLK
ncbi:DUF2911 domain-containing protein [Ferruginibacter sp. HRS2-29]|uniref:DUF2911 domain-containing protein n=1 Tax=Ferruginibacter sp. HRS2-29 TaxID=2487334 RepID=UPI0020CE1D1B|nr:DUF2911 domain-containing protein [Ferruginibacter sp. HRS2-29]MCP9750532.1 DUF2911 domain-containing protein [Ferruginibacter sp. HRS2-29]MCP9751237.1 DUF2911 domain-containing protein [Ferruginibacter sp. HRS2-29]MCP9751530.1 DUF2911 domain-containing protein [Ferruginibacter sp. HRS2-29]